MLGGILEKFSIAIIAGAITVNACFAQQSAFFSPWLLGLFAALALMMFAIFWLMKNQSPQVLPPPPPNGYGELHKNSGEMPRPEVRRGFYEVAPENRPLPADRKVIEHMRKKMLEVKKRGLPKKGDSEKRIHEAVEEILQSEFEKRKPEFRGAAPKPPLLPGQEAESGLFASKHMDEAPSLPQKKKEIKKAKKKRAARKKPKKKPAGKKARKKPQKRKQHKKPKSRAKSPKKKARRKNKKSKKAKARRKKAYGRKTGKRGKKRIKNKRKKR